MLFIPELRTVIILVPKNASTSIIEAVKEKYKEAFILYRHMEADGVPFGYTAWKKVGVIREPVERLWSLYRFIKQMTGRYNEGYLATLRDSVSVPFNTWITENTAVFTNPFDPTDNTWFNPRYTVNWLLPETRKSQLIHLRPDLGTHIYRFEYLRELENDLDISLKMSNKTLIEEPVPILNEETKNHINRYFKIDLQFYR